MIFNNFNKKDVEFALDCYKDFPDGTSARRYMQSNGELPNNFDEFCSAYSKTFLPMTKCRIKSLLQNLVMWRDLSENMPDSDMEILNKLIGDHKLRKKMQIVYDGSYLANRIWMDYENNILVELSYNGNPDITEDIKEKFKRLNNSDRIDYLYNHFDTIFIQIPSYTYPSIPILEYEDFYD